jgi:hypothetical protein
MPLDRVKHSRRDACLHAYRLKAMPEAVHRFDIAIRDHCADKLSESILQALRGSEHSLSIAMFLALCGKIEKQMTLHRALHEGDEAKLNDMGVEYDDASLIRFDGPRLRGQADNPMITLCMVTSCLRS